MKKLNEDVQDLLNLDKDINQTPNLNTLIKTNKKKRVSILDSLPATEQEIIIPKSLAEQKYDDVVQKIQEKDVKNQIIDKFHQQIKANNKDLKLPQQNQITKEEFEIVTGKELPENINVPELAESIENALNNLPDGKDIKLEDIQITASKVIKDKNGYFKTKSNIGTDKLPNVVRSIASYVKTQSKGLISARICDLRVIANTNKTQLRGSSLKLTSLTVVFKPDFTKLKVNKGTRFIISIPEDFESTGNLLVYLQESRAKKIIEVTGKDFKTEQIFVEFIGDRIAEYYFHGYDVTLKKLELRKINNPLMPLISLVLNTNEYVAKPYTDDDGHIFSVDFKAKETENNWLRVNIDEALLMGTYDIKAINEVDEDWEFKLTTKAPTMSWLMNNIIIVLKKAFETDWTPHLSAEDEDMKLFYLYKKLSHAKLKKALYEINDIATEQPEIGIVIEKTLSKTDTSKLLKNDYDSEAIICKTAFIDWFVLSYLAYQIIGGDKRNGKDYITTDDYYDKYDIKNRGPYQKRERTIHKKQDSERNYNSRIYLFQLEYSVKGQKHIYRAKTFNEIVENTGILSEDIKFPKTQY